MHKPGSDGDTQSHAMDKWLETMSGRVFCGWQARQLAGVMPRILGYRLLQIGQWSLDMGALGASSMLQRWVVTAQPGPQTQVLVQEAQLPVASRSMDAVLLPHSLELSQHPHALLREVDRVLCERGQLIVLGFNPLSLWHFGKYLPQHRHPQLARHGRLYTCGRVCDWLALLDFEVDSLTRFGKVLPWTGDISQYQDARRWLAPFGQAYMIFARKRVVPLTPVRRRWRPAIDLGSTVLPEARVLRRVA